MSDDLDSAMNSEINATEEKLIKMREERENKEKENKEISEVEELKPPEITSPNNLEIKERIKYYDHTATTDNAVPGLINTIDTEDIRYNREQINRFRRNQNAPKVWVINDGTDNLFVRTSQVAGFEDFSDENLIYPGDYKVYYNVYELRLRSPTLGLPYRVSEYEIQRICCPSAEITTTPVTISGQPIAITNSSGLSPTWIQGTEQTAPGAGTALVTRLVTAGKSGFIYGFLITTQEANNFLISWTSGTVARSIRIVFGGAGTTQDSEDVVPLNAGLPADASSIITITNVTAGGVAAIYQARLLYAES